MLQLGVIEPSNSSWSSPMRLVVKPNKVRICIDAKKLNSVTEKDAYSLPNIEGIFVRLPKANIISKLDLKDAFWQIGLDEKSKPLTAFTVPERPLYQFVVMPFGLCNAAQTMCRLMDEIIPPNLRHSVFGLRRFSNSSHHNEKIRAIMQWPIPKKNPAGSRVPQDGIGDLFKIFQL